MKTNGVGITLLLYIQIYMTKDTNLEMVNMLFMSRTLNISKFTYVICNMQ